MNAEQQRRENSHGPGDTGGTRVAGAGQQQTFTAWDRQRALTNSLMEQVCDPENLIRAYRRVRSNKGKPGVDGMTVHELADWLRQNHAALTASLLDGTCQPQPVRGVRIPKPGGGQRQLGIPVAVDRLVQQAILQGAESPHRPHLFQLQLRIPPWTRRSSGVSTGTEICSPGGARDCRRLGSGEILRPGQSRYLDVPSRAQDRRQTPPSHHSAFSPGWHDAGGGVRSPRRGNATRRSALPSC